MTSTQPVFCVRPVDAVGLYLAPRLLPLSLFASHHSSQLPHLCYIESCVLHLLLALSSSNFLLFLSLVWFLSRLSSLVWVGFFFWVSYFLMLKRETLFLSVQLFNLFSRLTQHFYNEERLFICLFVGWFVCVYSFIIALLLKLKVNNINLY